MPVDGPTMSEVLYEADRGVGRIVINRPEQRNALNPAVLAGMRSALRAAVEDAGVRVVTVTGAGDHVFCAGADLKASAAPQSGDDLPHFGRSDYKRLLLDLLGCPKPTVALARGHVMAGGMGILLSCDLALACEDVHFSTPEVRVGMFPMMVLALLTRHVGRKKATEMLFLGERLQAAEAARLGIVNHAYPRERFDAEAERFIASLAEKSLEILGMGKKAMAEVEDMTLFGSLDHLEAALAELMRGEDSKEGIRAFVEKRKPRWKH